MGRHMAHTRRRERAMEGAFERRDMGVDMGWK
jgi:hypothetical protein